MMSSREADSGAASPVLRSAGFLKTPRSRRETCALRLARAIRRANRAGAKARPRA